MCLTDRWQIDVLVVVSQKALMIPPGLAMLAISGKAWRQIEPVEPQAFYFDLKLHRQTNRRKDTRPRTQHALDTWPHAGRALAESLSLIRAEGIEAVWATITGLSRAAIAGMEAMGLAVFARRPAEG